jgi:hypothetical protein
MNSTMRNLTLSAAALAALTVIAPKAAAQEHVRGGGRGNAPQQQGSPSFRGNGRQEGGHRAYGGNRESYGRGGFDSHGGYGYRSYGGYGGHGGYGHGYAAPVRPFARYGYGYAAPFRIFSGFRFFSACPGPNYVYIANYGWALPPFFGAVWIPGHYDIGGYWVEGFWQ